MKTVRILNCFDGFKMNDQTSAFVVFYFSNIDPRRYELSIIIKDSNLLQISSTVYNFCSALYASTVIAYRIYFSNSLRYYIVLIR